MSTRFAKALIVYGVVTIIFHFIGNVTRVTPSAGGELFVFPSLMGLWYWIKEIKEDWKMLKNSRRNIDVEENN